MEHTPTPWVAEQWSLGSWDIYSGNQIAVVITNPTRDPKQHQEIMEANTHHIVKAVNPHDKLVEACKESLRFVIGEKANIPSRDGLFNLLEQALAEVGG